MTPESYQPFDPLVVNGFFDVQTCERIGADLRSAAGSEAAVYRQIGSGTVDERIRKATLMRPSLETIGFVRRRLLECKTEIGTHFEIDLSDCEEPQFLRYVVGGFFVAHQDGNTPLLQLERDRVRRISVIIPLNHQSAEPRAGTYCGGSLVFSGRLLHPDCQEIRESADAGTLIAFRSETTHEVTPVTNGERLSIVSWYR